jgi:TonB family protein
MNSRNDLNASATPSDIPVERLAVWLIQHAARRSPPSLAERLEEEWFADLSAQAGALSRLRFALGCCWATRVIALDPIAFGAPAARTATAHVAVATYAPHDSPLFSRRTLVLLFIVGLHLIVFYSFNLGLGGTIAEALPTRIKTIFIDEPSPPTPPPPVLDPTPGDWPTVRPQWDDPVISLTETVVTSEGPVITPFPDLPTPEPTPLKRVLGGPGSGFPSTADFYPPTSRRIGESGVTAVRVCVDGHGRLTTDPTIWQSSGSARLDEGALALARAGSGRYRSTTEDGNPVTYCYPFRVRFQLKE